MRTSFSNLVEVAGIHTAKASEGLKLLKGRALIVKGRSHPTFCVAWLCGSGNNDLNVTTGRPPDH